MILRLLLYRLRGKDGQHPDGPAALRCVFGAPFTTLTSVRQVAAIFLLNSSNAVRFDIHRPYIKINNAGNVTVINSKRWM